MTPDENDDENENVGLEELEKLVQVERQDFLLLIKTLSYILKRTSTFIMKPTKLQQELREKLHLNDNKVDAIMKMWIRNMKPMFDSMHAHGGGAGGDDAGEANELLNASWKLKVQLSSEAQQKEKTPIAQLQLTTRHGPPTNLEVNHTELLGLYNQLEAIQGELDALRNK